MADILLTHSYFMRFDPKEWRAMMPYAPLGTLYAAAVLRKKGYAVELFDSMLAESEQSLRAHFIRHQPRVCVIYDDDFNYLTKMCLGRMREAAFTMSKIAKEFDCTVVVHGSDAADHIEDYLNHGADYVIVGEGDITLSELINQLFQHEPGDLSAIDGLAYRSNGSIRQNPRRAVLHDLDSLPTPAWDLVDVDLYRRTWIARHGYFSMNLVTTRGCPYHCNWCAKPIYGQVYNCHSPEYIVEEMGELKSKYSPDHLWMCDDIFGLKPGWIPRFAEVVRTRDAQIPFKCLSRADLLLREDAIRHLARSGCKTVWIGAESGSQKILDAMEKGTTVEQIYRSTQMLHDQRIRVGFFLQYGYPGETRDDIDLTLRMVRDCKPDEIGISISYPLPGTKFFERVKAELGEKKNWVDSQDLAMMYHGPYTTEFYRALHRLTHKQFRIWQGIDLLNRHGLHLTLFSRSTARRLAATAYHTLTIPFIRRKVQKLAHQPVVDGKNGVDE